MAGRAGPEPNTGDAGPARPEDQPGDGDPLADSHVRDRGDPAADAPIDQVAAGGEHQEVAGAPDVPAVGAQRRDISGPVHQLRAGLHQLVGQAREQPLHDPAAALQQAVSVPTLRQPLASGRCLGEVIALQQRDIVEMAGQHPGRQHPGQAAADDHGVTATRDS